MTRRFIMSMLMSALLCPTVNGAVFDWRDIDGNNFITPVKNQQKTSSCWAFATVAALEAKFAINAEQPDLKYDLSEQHLISDPCCGDTDGGYTWQALKFFVSDGITDEATLPFSGGDTAPEWPLQGDYPIYSVTEVDVMLAGGFSTENVKAVLEMHGPLVATMQTTDWYRGGSGSQLNFATPAEVKTCAGDATGGGWHAVLVVGYVDDAELDSGGFWTVKNSYGPAWGDEGYGYVKYGVLEGYRAIHAITGQTIVIPEPSPFTLTMSLLPAIVFWCARRSR